MLTQLPRRPPPPGSRGTAQDWRCSHCDFTLATVTPRGLVVLAPQPAITAESVRVRCPSCRHAATLPLARLAA